MPGEEFEAASAAKELIVTAESLVETNGGTSQRDGRRSLEFSVKGAQAFVTGLSVGEARLFLAPGDC